MQNTPRLEMLARIRLSKNLNVKLKCTDLATLATENHHSFLRGQRGQHQPIGSLVRLAVHSNAAVIHKRAEDADQRGQK